MRTTGERFDSRCRATLLGAAVADALAFPYKGYSRGFLQSLARSVTESFEREASGFFPVGQYTDDTQIALAVIHSILETGEVRRDLVADYMIPLWRDLTVVDADAENSEAMGQLVRGFREWRESGLEPGNASCGALSRAIPVGLWNATAVDRIPEHAELVTRVTHNDRRVIASVAGFATAIAYNVTNDELILGVFLDRMADAAGTFHEPLAQAVLDLPRVLSQTDVRAWALIEGVCEDSRYPSRDDGMSDYVIHSFLLSLYYFLKCPDAFEEPISRCLRMGGRVDAVTTTTGALIGSFNGMDSIPTRLVDDVMNRAELLEAVDDLLVARERRLEPPPRGKRSSQKGNRT